MEWIFLLYSAFLGAAVGSFLNVVVLRFQTGRTLSGRSACLSCASKLKWFDLVPVFSFFILRGRCRSCRSKISWQYPLVEILTAVVFFFIGREYAMNSDSVVLLYGLIIWPLLLAILVYDLRHKIIPNSFVFSFVFIALLFRIYLGFAQGFTTLWLFDLLAGPFLYLPFYLLWKISDGRWMGLGDGNLSLGIGFSLGLSGGISAIILGFWIGAFIGIFLMISDRILRKKNYSMKTELPFAPFLIAGMFLVQFFGYSFINIGW